MDIVHGSNIVFSNSCSLPLILIDTDSSEIVQLSKMLRYSILASDQVLDFKRIKILPSATTMKCKWRKLNREEHDHLTRSGLFLLANPCN